MWILPKVQKIISWIACLTPWQPQVSRTHHLWNLNASLCWVPCSDVNTTSNTSTHNPYMGVHVSPLDAPRESSALNPCLSARMSRNGTVPSCSLSAGRHFSVWKLSEELTRPTLPPPQNTCAPKTSWDADGHKMIENARLDGYSLQGRGRAQKQGKTWDVCVGKSCVFPHMWSLQGIACGSTNFSTFIYLFSIVNCMPSAS